MMIDQSKTLIFYHRADLDGHCSGAICKLNLPDAELIGIDYGDPFPCERVKGAEVVMVDFSLQPWSDMQWLAKKAASLLWIDHHKTAIAAYEKDGLPDITTVVLDPEYAACELAWMHFNPGYPMPTVVRLLGRYDVWDHGDELTVPFQMGMRLEDHDPARDLDFWKFKGFPCDPPAYWFSDTIAAGKHVLEYQKQCNERLMRCAFPVEFKGKRFLAVNAGEINSLAFAGAYDPGEHDAVMAFILVAPGRWKVSMYSPDQSEDCSGIAKEMGGGGHAYACGFEVSDLGEVLG